jgi:hypothetical protein
MSGASKSDRNSEGVIWEFGIPVRIVWNADSTFEASSADVSMNDSPFSAV